jgi:hypothetical protein
MTPQAFVKSRPCLEEIEGYLMTKDLSVAPTSPELKKLVEAVTAQRRNAPPSGVAPLGEDGLKIIEMWRRELLTGKDVPGPTKMERLWTYTRGRKPVRRKAKL